MSVVSSGDRVAFLAEGSTLFWTTDNGSTWAYDHPVGWRYDETHYSDAVHNRLAYAGTQTAFVSQWNGLYVRSGSSDWELRPINGSYDAGAIAFATPLVGWCGSPQARTTDGGATWSPMSVAGDGDGYIHGFTPIDTLNAWAYTSAGTLKRTTNGGIDWSTVSTFVPGSTNETGGLLDISVDADGRAIAVGKNGHGGYLLRTTDHGSTWTRTEFPLTYRKVLHPGDSIWVLIGNDDYGPRGNEYQPSFLRSTDGGMTWVEGIYPTGGPAPKSAVWHAPTSTMFAGGSRGVIYRSTDLGLTWLEISKPSPNVSDIVMMNIIGVGQVGIAAAGPGYILRSTDDGSSWRRSDISGYSGRYFRTAAPGGQSVWISGGPSLFRSTDAGLTWSRVPTRADSMAGVVVLSLSFLEGSHGLATASDLDWVWGASVALITTDGGSTWSGAPLPEYLQAQAGHFVEANTIFVGGLDWRHGSVARGFVARSTDHGLSWTVSELPSPVTSIHFLVPSTGVCGTHGGLWKTTNGGTSWTQFTDLPNYESVNDIWFRSLSEGYAVQGSVILQTLNGGADWIPYEQLPTNASGRAIAMSSSWDFFVSTDLGGFVASKPAALLTTVVAEPGTVPDRSSVRQNYPNPFNASTVIPLDLQSPGHVRIVVYDLLGRMVGVIADREFSRGGHLLAWDAAGLPSGIYLCVITRGSEREFMKMVLSR